MWKRREGRIFLIAHACLLVGCLLLPFYLRITSHMRFLGCVLHDRLYLYCAFCGGTRAFSALLHFQILDAIRYNALVVGLVVWALVLDVVVLVRLLQNRRSILRFPRNGWVLMVCILVAFMILRNVLMIFWGFDPTSDLGAVWQNWKT